MVVLEVVVVVVHVSISISVAIVLVHELAPVVHGRFVLLEVPVVHVACILAVLFESLLNLLVAVLVLNALQGHLHHFWVDGVAWFSKFMVFMCKMAFVAECADFMRFVVPASLRFIFIIDLINIGRHSVVIMVIAHIVVGVHLIDVHLVDVHLHVHGVHIHLVVHSHILHLLVVHHLYNTSVNIK